MAGHFPRESDDFAIRSSTRAASDFVLPLYSVCRWYGRLPLDGRAETSSGGGIPCVPVQPVPTTKSARVLLARCSGGRSVRWIRAFGSVQRHLECSQESRFHEPAVSHFGRILVLDLRPRRTRSRLLFSHFERGVKTSSDQLWAICDHRSPFESGNAFHSMESSLARS